VVVPCRQHGGSHARRADLRGGVSMRHCPPDLRSLDPRRLLQLLSEEVVIRWGDQTDVCRHEKELHRSIIHGNDAVVEIVVHP